MLRARPLEVSTPTAVIGVRGTVYRVRNDVTPATAAASAVNASATEVLEGKVHAQVGTAAAQAADVPAKFGAPLEAGQEAGRAAAAARARPVRRCPRRSTTCRSACTSPAALPLRVQVADDAAFDHIQLDLHVDAGDDVRIPRLADGTVAPARARASAPRASKAWTRCATSRCTRGPRRRS